MSCRPRAAGARVVWPWHGPPKLHQDGPGSRFACTPEALTECIRAIGLCAVARLPMRLRSHALPRRVCDRRRLRGRRLLRGCRGPRLHARHPTQPAQDRPLQAPRLRAGSLGSRAHSRPSRRLPGHTHPVLRPAPQLRSLPHRRRIPHRRASRVVMAGFENAQHPYAVPHRPW